MSALQLHAVLEAARAHHAELTFIAENLPQYLPGQATRPSGECYSLQPKQLPCTEELLSAMTDVINVRALGTSSRALTCQVSRSK